jgi:hypothetical protein
MLFTAIIDFPLILISKIHEYFNTPLSYKTNKKNKKIMETNILSYWWILPLLTAIIGYKFVLRVFFGMVIVPEDKVGLVTKKFVLFGPNKELPDGRIIATQGEAGYQAKALAPGLYWMLWPWQYSIEMTGFILIPEGKIGLILANDGAQIPTGKILGRKVESDTSRMQKSFYLMADKKGAKRYTSPQVLIVSTLSPLP